MNPSPIGKKELFFSLLIGLLIVGVQIIIPFFDTRTKIVFCDVGQGDGAYIRIRNRFDVVIDAGPDRKILNCLGRYMPFYDRTIELAILSHDQKDHFGGYEYILDRYSIKKFIVSPIQKSNKAFLKLKEKLVKKKTRIEVMSKGSVIKVFDDFFSFYWPINPCISNNDNDCSLVFTFREDYFKALFTGDASPFSLNSLSEQSIKNMFLLKIPHHGSKNGLTEKFLQLAEPATAVISVGKKNSYGHPSKEVLDMLQSHKMKIRRTDVEGNIVFRLHD